MLVKVRMAREMRQLDTSLTDRQIFNYWSIRAKWEDGVCSKYAAAAAKTDCKPTHCISVCFILICLPISVRIHVLFQCFSHGVRQKQSRCITERNMLLVSNNHLTLQTKQKRWPFPSSQFCSKQRMSDDSQSSFSEKKNKLVRRRYSDDWIKHGYIF